MKKPKTRTLKLLPNYRQSLNNPLIKHSFCDFTLVAIKESIEKKLSEARILSLPLKKCDVILDRSKFKDSLDKLILEYENSEEFEKCAECRDLKKLV